MISVSVYSIIVFLSLMHTASAGLARHNGRTIIIKEQDIQWSLEVDKLEVCDKIINSGLTESNAYIQGGSREKAEMGNRKLIACDFSCPIWNPVVQLDPQRTFLALQLDVAEKDNVQKKMGAKLIPIFFSTLNFLHPTSMKSL
ncbi:unnamed protein product [Albugo candida]|uniref:Uncharacterized protein n=1 Tax=Albugo candida TaxID=65357 RepID=A0A024FX07_9STRA|nr:unnamed protein product [Albugo candida]|eukprot:CCI11718.1 unnamed protein product [Albugo candida]